MAPTPVLFPRRLHGWRSLVGYSPWGYKESDTTGHGSSAQKRLSQGPMGKAASDPQPGRAKGLGRSHLRPRPIYPVMNKTAMSPVQLSLPMCPAPQTGEEVREESGPHLPSAASRDSEA